MAELYTYYLWNGKKIIGYIQLVNPLAGKFFVMPTVSGLKAEYGRRYETITLPIIYLKVSNYGGKIVTERFLDVRRKSKRQIRLLFKNGAMRSL